MAIYAEITGRAVRAYMATTDKRGFRLVSEFGRLTATPLRVVFVGNKHYNELVRRDASAASKKRSLEPAKLEAACPPRPEQTKYGAADRSGRRLGVQRTSGIGSRKDAMPPNLETDCGAKPAKTETENAHSPRRNKRTKENEAER